MDRKIMIELHTTIDDGGQMEYNTIKQKGNLYKRDNFDVLTFEERTDDNETVKNLITIQPERVSIKRSGRVSMNQQFQKEQTTENVFQHPHGNIHMETYTNSIDYQPLHETNEGQLNISYTVKLNGQEERKQVLSLTYKEVSTG